MNGHKAQHSHSQNDAIKFKTRFVLTLFFSLFFSTSLLAQDASDETEDGYAEDSVMEEILVTASKRGLVSAQDFAGAITAFDASRLDRLNAVEFEELIVQVPSTNFISNGGPGRGFEVASIRGLSPVSDSTQPVVSQYLDGSPRFGANYRLYDVGEVFVLRGPQGTLWGNQSLGGVISFNSNRPDTTAVEGLVQGDLYTSKDDGGLSYRLTGVINLPIIEDKLAFRLAVQTIDETGYVDNITTGVDDVNNVDELSWRASMLYQPTDRISITAIYHDNDLESDAPSFFSTDHPDYITESPTTLNPADEDWNLFNLIIDIDFDWATLTYNGSWFDLDRTVLDSGDFFGFTGFNGAITEQESNTHELRLASTSDNRFGWIAGLYYDDLDELDFVDFTDLEDFEVFFFGGPTQIREKAVFGEVTFDFTEKFQMLLGARFYDWKVDDVPLFRFFGADFSNLPGTAKDDGSLFKLQGNYQQNDNVLWYGLVSQGFRIGGFNAGVNEAVGFPDEFSQYDPDELTNYEAGYKSVWKDGQMIFNAAVYYMDWKNVQSVVSNEAGNVFITANVPDLKAWGLEIESVIQDLFWSGFYVGMTYSYTKNEFQDDAVLFEGGTVNIKKGDELRRTPRNSWSLDVGYDWVIGGNWDAYVRANYWHKDSTTTSGFNRFDGIIDVPSQNVVNCSIGAMSNGWETKLYINNLTNERPLLQIFPEGPSSTQPTEASSIRPRTFGVIVGKRF